MSKIKELVFFSKTAGNTVKICKNILENDTFYKAFLCG
jgi:hypothetical protein